MKKREIGLYGTCFGEDLSKIQRFEDLGKDSDFRVAKSKKKKN